MKNMRIRSKMIAGFMIVAVIAAVVGGVGVVGLQKLEDDSQQINLCAVNTNNVALLMENLQQQRVLYRDIILEQDNPQKQAEIAAAMEELYVQADERAAYLRGNLLTEGERELWASIEQRYAQEYAPLRDALMEAALQGDNDRAVQLLGGIVPAADTILSEVRQLNDRTVALSGDTSRRANSKANAMTTVMVAVSVGIVVVGVLLGLYFSGMVAKPVKKLVQAAQMLMNGDVEADVDISQKDEMGDLSQAFTELIDEIKQQSQLLQTVAQGDYTVQVPVRSPRDVMNQAIGQLTQNGNNAMTELKAASSQMLSAAGQISQSSQNLASGSATQAATIEEFSQALDMLVEKTKQNAQQARHMQEVSDLAGGQMQESVKAMEQVLAAMKDIGESAGKLTKVIGVIEDIAFQTNILSLNAAVEAAHAGVVGKGFAVVADEVRMLAAKSAAAARESAVLIDASVSAVKEGSRLVRHAGEQIDRASANAQEAMGSVDVMAEATHEQEVNLDKLGESIDSISAVVQANSATAQQVAAAAEELDSQAGVLDGIIARYKLRESISQQVATGAEAAASAQPDNILPLFNGKFSLNP